MSTLETTVSMLELLPERELLVIQKLVKRIFESHEKDNPFQPLTEEQIYALLAVSRQQAETGECDDADDFYKEMTAKYGV